MTNIDLEALGRRLAIEDSKGDVDRAYARGWITWGEWCHRIRDISLMTVDIAGILAERRREEQITADRRGNTPTSG